MDHNKELKEALNSFISRVNEILGQKLTMICLHGSIMYNDLSPGYSDLDFHCLCTSHFTEEEKDQLFEYRKELKGNSNVYSRMLEGEFAPISVINKPMINSVVYWGTSREKLFDTITIRSFTLTGLKKNGIVIYGKDLRGEYPQPSYQVMVSDIYILINSIRKYVASTNEDVHSVDWFFLISQSLFWLENGDVTSKTKAAEWVLSTYTHGWSQYLNKAIQLRKFPDDAKIESNRKWLSSLGPTIQLACDDLNKRVQVAN